MDFLQLAGKKVVVFGVANKKSVAWHVAQTLEEAGALVIHVVRSEARRESTAKLLAGKPVFVCDVEFEEQIQGVAKQIGEQFGPIDGLVHSIAFADYEGGMKPFHETGRRQFLRTIEISCYSLLAICNHFQSFLSPKASVVTISISKTSASAGIPGYVDAYLYAEKVIPRKRAVETQEAANVVAFLLSPRSSGITAQTIVVDAGMEINYFDQELIDSQQN